MIATIWEVWNDRKGDFNKGFDVFIRMILFTLEAYILHLIFDKSVLVSLVIPFAVFFLFFDYLIAAVLIRNGVIQGHWFNYQAKSGVVDNIGFWKRMNPWLKLGVRLIVFIVAVLIFTL